MLVRGAGETFNLIIPVRRMREYAKRSGVIWAIDENSKVPSYSDIISLPIEGTIKGQKGDTKSKAPENKSEFPFLLNPFRSIGKYSTLYTLVFSFCSGVILIGHQCSD